MNVFGEIQKKERLITNFIFLESIQGEQKCIVFNNMNKLLYFFVVVVVVILRQGRKICTLYIQLLSFILVYPYNFCW